MEKPASSADQNQKECQSQVAPVSRPAVLWVSRPTADNHPRAAAAPKYLESGIVRRDAFTTCGKKFIEPVFEIQQTSFERYGLQPVRSMPSQCAGLQPLRDILAAGPGAGARNLNSRTKAGCPGCLAFGHPGDPSPHRFILPRHNPGCRRCLSLRDACCRSTLLKQNCACKNL
jgi:hypothetical protein